MIRWPMTAVALCAFMFSATSPVHAEIITEVLGTNNYLYEVTDLEDFDQRRCDPFGTMCLPNNGNSHCVPTSTADLTAYMANHGFPEIPPGERDWQSWVNYPDATEVIRDFGELMLTSPTNGTFSNNWFFALTGGGIFDGIIPLDKFTVVQFNASQFYTPRLPDIAQHAIANNGLVAICHGWYQEIDLGGETCLFRNGGHCMAVRKIRIRPGLTDILETRDPATDGDVLSQSTFSTSTYNVSDVPVQFFGVPLCDTRTMSRLTPDWASSTSRYLDCYVGIIPKSGYTWDDSVSAILTLSPGFLSDEGPSFTSFPIAGEVSDLIPCPDLHSVVAIIGAELSEISLLTGEATPIVTPNLQSPRRVAFNRQRNLLVLNDSGRTLLRVDADDDLPVEYEETPLPLPCNVLVADDQQDEVVLISAANSMLLRMPWNARGTIEQLAIPVTVPLTGTLHMAIMPGDGSVLIASNKYDALTRLREDPETGRLLATEYSNPELTSADGMDVDDTGLIYVSVQGEVKVFKIEAATGELRSVPEAPLAGMDAGPVFKLTHSRTNFDQAIHETPEWHNVFPPQEQVEQIDCVADLSGPEGAPDGEVGTADFFALLQNWGPCPNAPAGCPWDISGDSDAPDGAVGTADFFKLLQNWGPCPQ